MGRGSTGPEANEEAAAMSAVKTKQPIFCEILDQRTQQLIAEHPSLGKACHFLASNRLISKILAMVSEAREVAAILRNLLSGSIAICLKSSSTYVDAAEIVPFYTIQKRAQLLDHVKKNMSQFCSYCDAFVKT